MLVTSVKRDYLHQEAPGKNSGNLCIDFLIRFNQFCLNIKFLRTKHPNEKTMAKLRYDRLVYLRKFIERLLSSKLNSEARLASALSFSLTRPFAR